MIPGILAAALAASVSAQTVRSIPVVVPTPVGAAGAAPVVPSIAPSLAPSLALQPFRPLQLAPTAGLRARAAASSDRPGGWTSGLFESPVDGLEIHYRSHGPNRGKPRIFVGGMALAQSFESYFRTQLPEQRQYELTLRGLAPTKWSKAPDQLDADARDLGRMIVAAARETGASSLELVVHSYSAFAFQRLLQLDDAESREALALLAGSRVIWIAATTHWKGSESQLMELMGPQFVLALENAKLQAAYLDSMDRIADRMRAIADGNPWMRAQAEAWIIAWEAQRAAFIYAAGEASAQLMQRHLEDRWTPDIDPIRRELHDAVARESNELGWREAALRRMLASLPLDFTTADADRLRGLGIRLELLHAKDDQFIPWKAERFVLRALGIDAPERTPKPGEVLRDASGLVSVRVVDGDHYFPLKRPGAFREFLDP
ncbi:MAG: hypothetical protein HY925_13000 [Elusimicrobia bacterium]|nr:hypothetical protein [Elusimicrobiota bacterium]